jgi:putative N6-adenine-specific DNA methylase
VAYRTKDAIVDYFNEKYGKRPSVRINRPDIYIHIHISHHNCTISLDSSGESLHKRGYRLEQVDAPLNEVLAAGMILKTGWRGGSHFVDPMCGSGTLLIEAAMIALNLPPGLFQKEYAFERWVDFDRAVFEEICQDDAGEREFTFKCYGSDISPKAIEKAQKNVENAGLSRYIELQVLPFQQYSKAPKPGILVTNPPYGERISAADIMSLYAMIGERLKHVFAGYQAWILSYKDECFDKIGLRPGQKMKLMNGRLECEYRCYELFKGTNKEYKTTLHETQRFDRDQKERRKPFVKEQGAHGSEKRTYERKERGSLAPSLSKGKGERGANQTSFMKREGTRGENKAPFTKGERTFSKPNSKEKSTFAANKKTQNFSATRKEKSFGTAFQKQVKRIQN